MNSMKNDIPRGYLRLFAFLAFLVAVIYGLGMLFITRGHLVAPLDDTYIHYQYSRMVASGHFFEYTKGSGFSTGSTSLLYPILLAPFFIIGVKAVGIVLVSFAIGIFIFFLSACLIYLIGRGIAHECVGVLSALLFLLNGHLAWNQLSGMETGLFGLLLLSGIYFILRWWGERHGALLGWGFVFLTLASLTRPEGFIILAGVIIYLMARARRIHGGRALLTLFCAAPFLLYMLLVRVETGRFATAGVLAKSVCAAPYYTFWEKIARLVDNFAYIFSAYYHNLSNNYFPDWAMFPAFPTGALYPFLLFPPGIFLLACAGVILGGARERGSGQFGPVLLMSLCLLLGLAAITNSEVVPIHCFRYLAPFQPIFLILAALGLYEISKFFEASSVSIFRLAGALMLILIVPSIFYWAYVYGENCNDIFEQHRRTSWWLKDSTPPEAVIGVTDTGVIGYFSERRIYDFVGLSTPEQARHWRQGLGSAFERLEHLPPESLPDYIVTFPYVWGEMNFLGKPIHNAPLRKNLTTMSNDFVVYQQDWSFFKSGNASQLPPDGMALADSLDVADLQDEEAHGYIWREAAERPVGWKFPTPRNFFFKAKAGERMIADGGRDLTGYESFTVRLAPGRPARLIARTEGADACAAIVSFNGVEVGTLLAAAGKKGAWQEISINIPSEVVTAHESVVRVEFDGSSSRTPSFHSYHYWFYQEK